MKPRGAIRRAIPAIVALTVWWGLAGSSSVAHAQEDGAEAPSGGLDVMVLRGTEGEAPGERVDEVLLRSLSSTAGVENPAVSPLDLTELAMAAGCDPEASTCLAAMAAHLQVDAVLVRQLTVEDGQTRLILRWYDPHLSDAIPAVERAWEDAPGDLGALVDGAVRELFGIPDAPPADQAVAGGSAAADSSGAEPSLAGWDGPVGGDGGGVGIGPWVAVGVGGAALAAGVAFGVMSQGSESDYGNTAIRTAEDADRARDRLETAEAQATAANVLFLAGGVALGVGVTWMILDLAGGSGDAEEVPAFTGAITPGGAWLGMRGRWGNR